MPKEHVRKQVYLLSSQDLLEHPIWEFLLDEEGLDEQDEATVRPSENIEVPGYSPGEYIVAADITYADGSRGEGYVYSGRPNDFGCVQPNGVLPSGQINLWLGSLKFIPRWKEVLADQTKLLGSKAALFPMSFTTRANVNEEPLKIVAEGFLARDLDGQTITVR